MIFNIDEVTVYFPYEYIYKEQKDYMIELKVRGSPAIFSVPSFCLAPPPVISMESSSDPALSTLLDPTSSLLR